MVMELQIVVSGRGGGSQTAGQGNTGSRLRGTIFLGVAEGVCLLSTVPQHPNMVSGQVGCLPSRGDEHHSCPGTQRAGAGTGGCLEAHLRPRSPTHSWVGPQVLCRAEDMLLGGMWPSVLHPGRCREAWC